MWFPKEATVHYVSGSFFFMKIKLVIYQTKPIQYNTLFTIKNQVNLQKYTVNLLDYSFIFKIRQTGY